MKKFITKISLVSVAVLVLISCSADSLEPVLATERDLTATPIESIRDLEFLSNGMYKRMSNASYYGRDYIIFNEARTDNAYSIGSSNRFVTVSEMKVNIGDAYPADTWVIINRVILNANYIINSNVVIGEQEEIDNLKGQALTVRAMAHFDLLKLYGQQHIENQGEKNAITIPYVEIAANNSEIVLSMSNVRNTLEEVRTKIYKDLDEAISKISNKSDKTKITKQAALGIKSRIALYFATFYPSDYQVSLDAAVLAMNEGGEVISSTNFEGQFTGNIINSNSVFELAVPSDDNLGNTGLYEIYSGLSYGDVVAQNDTPNLYEENDIRLNIIKKVGPYFRNVGKYTTYADNVILMRYEELLLNAAEASMHINATPALGYINQIREKRDVPPLTSITLDDVLLERNRELIFEGFRFDDLMRLKRDVPTNPRMTDTYLYGNFRIAFPIPLTEINASAMKQNFGY